MVRGEASYRNTLRLSREAKRRRTGTCRVCGAVTRYAGKPGKPVSELCPEHAARENGERQRGTGALQLRILDYLSEPRRYSEIRAEMGVDIGMSLHRLLRYGKVERVKRGVYVRAS